MSEKLKNVPNAIFKLMNDSDDESSSEDNIQVNISKPTKKTKLEEKDEAIDFSDFTPEQFEDYKNNMYRDNNNNNNHKTIGFAVNKEKTNAMDYLEPTEEWKKTFSEKQPLRFDGYTTPYDFKNGRFGTKWRDDYMRRVKLLEKNPVIVFLRELSSGIGKRELSAFFLNPTDKKYLNEAELDKLLKDQQIKSFSSIVEIDKEKKRIDDELETINDEKRDLLKSSEEVENIRVDLEKFFLTEEYKIFTVLEIYNAMRESSSSTVDPRPINDSLYEFFLNYYNSSLTRNKSALFIFTETAKYYNISLDNSVQRISDIISNIDTSGELTQDIKDKYIKAIYNYLILSIKILKIVYSNKLIYEVYPYNELKKYNENEFTLEKFKEIVDSSVRDTNEYNLLTKFIRNVLFLKTESSIEEFDLTLTSKLDFIKLLLSPERLKNLYQFITIFRRLVLLHIRDLDNSANLFKDYSKNLEERKIALRENRDIPNTYEDDFDTIMSVFNTGQISFSAIEGPISTAYDYLIQSYPNYMKTGTKDQITRMQLMVSPITRTRFSNLIASIYQEGYLNFGPKYHTQLEYNQQAQRQMDSFAFFKKKDYTAKRNPNLYKEIINPYK